MRVKTGLAPCGLLGKLLATTLGAQAIERARMSGGGSLIPTTFVERPDRLPPLAGDRIVILDVAFASRDGFVRATEPFLREAGDRIALWLDHHDHPQWPAMKGDPRFVLVPRRDARACPQLITSALVQRIGPVDGIIAHADFDGCMAAAKYLRGGHDPYSGSDEDARFADAPGKGFSCTARGLGYLNAVEWLRHRGDSAALMAFLSELLEVLVNGVETPDFATKCAALGSELAEHRKALAPHLGRAARPHSEILFLRCDGLSGPDKKFVLRELEERARVAVVFEGGYTTAATFDDERLDLAAMAGMDGGAGYAWKQEPPEAILASLSAALNHLPR